MQKLVDVTRDALTEAESAERSPKLRDLLSDSLSALKLHEPALVKGYPMALLEVFAEGPGASASPAAKAQPVHDSGMDFGELSLMDDNEMHAQIELSKAQQLAVHATDAVLAELNTLVSSAQGLRSVQPERNPMRPDSYVRALQKCIADTGVVAEIRQLWMQHMRELLGKQLVDEYKNAVKSLREHGVQPVGYAVAGAPGGGSRAMATAPGYGGGHGGYGHSGGGYSPSMAAPLSGYGSGYGPSTGYGRGGGGAWAGESQQGALAAEAEEALLTVGILRQMLAGGDPFAAQGAMAPVVSSSVPLQPGMVQAQVSAHAPVSLSGGYVSQAAVEAMEDIAQLERIVGRLSHGGPAAGPVSGWRSLTPAMPPRVYTNVPLGAVSQSPAMAGDVVLRMMENIAQDHRLLPPVQRAVQNLGPALQRLVRSDLTFFDNPTHPARRMLDEMTQRSLAFETESALGFAPFMRLMDEAVAHLTRIDIKDAAPFENVLKALLSAWDTQERKLQSIKAKQDAKEKARRRAEQRELLAAEVADNIRGLPDLGNVPADVMEFAAGPWAQVIAQAQVSQPEGEAQDDPGGYLALVPMLLWSAQPDLTRSEPERLHAIIPGLLQRLREGLLTIQHPPERTSALIERLVSLHQAAFEMPLTPSALAVLEAPMETGEEVFAADEAAGVDDSFVEIDSVVPEDLAEEPANVDIVLESAPAPVEPVAAAPEPAPAPASAPVAAPSAPKDPLGGFVVGAWVELISNQRPVRTQLTWASPQGTLFLFTGADGSTQSMTRRMRDKLAAEGLLRVVS